MRIGFRVSLLSALLMIPAGAVASSLFGRSGADTRSYPLVEAEPALVTVEGELTVRPDLLVLPLRYVEVGKTAKSALEALQSQVRASVKGAGALAGVTVSAELSDLATSPRSDGLFEVALTGSLTIPLKDAADFWTRAALLAALEEHAARDATPPSRKSGETGPRRVYGKVTARITDAQAHVPELLAVSAKRSRALAQSTEEGLDSPLRVVECDPPGRVTQMAGTIMAVGLQLPVRCRLAAAEPSPKAAVAKVGP